MYFHFRNEQITFVSKVMRVQKANTVANNTRLCYTILVLFLEFHPSQLGLNFQYEQTRKFVLVTEPAWLLVTYGEVLAGLSSDWGKLEKVGKQRTRGRKGKLLLSPTPNPSIPALAFPQFEGSNYSLAVSANFECQIACTFALILLCGLHLR